MAVSGCGSSESIDRSSVATVVRHDGATLTNSPIAGIFHERI